MLNSEILRLLWGSDCTAEFDKNFHEASLKAIEYMFGKVVSTEELLKSMKHHTK